MKISVFGLGYVGAVTCGCFAKEGHSVIGVDVSKPKVDMINAGQSPIIEPEITDMIKAAVSKKLLRATLDANEAIIETDISFIAVGTPSKSNGSLDLSHIEKVCTQIGSALQKKKSFHIVVIRSTVLPGTIRGVVIPVLEKASKMKAGVDFGVAFNPEFLREGKAVYDFYNPPKTVIGAEDERSKTTLKDIYKNLPAKIFVTPIEVSEMVKYADNNFHAVKITFANEIGAICKKLGIDSHDVMNIFCEDKKLNISSHYLMPGFAFGGSCLPKDIRALTYKAKMLDIDTPLLNSLIVSNEKQVKSLIKSVLELGKKRIGILGFSFKAGTDDLRESPIVEVIEALIGKGYDIKLYDKNVNLARIIGANKAYIEEHIPHIAEIMSEKLEDVITHSEIIIIGNNAKEFKDVISVIGKDKIVLDLVRIDKDKKTEGNYIGLAW